MFGTITYYNQKEQQGSIQADDGKLLSFDAQSLDNNTGLETICMDLRVSFDTDQYDRVSNLKALKDQFLLDSNAYYEYPSTVGLASTTPQGFYLIDEDLHEITLIARNERACKNAFCSLAKNYGANVVLGFKGQEFTKNSIGFSYQMYQGRARFGIIGKKVDSNKVDEDQDHKVYFSLFDLKHLLNQEAILARFNDDKAVKKSAKFLKVVGIILLIIFTFGFIVSSL